MKLILGLILILVSGCGIFCPTCSPIIEGVNTSTIIDTTTNFKEDSLKIKAVRDSLIQEIQLRDGAISELSTIVETQDGQLSLVVKKSKQDSTKYIATVSYYKKALYEKYSYPEKIVTITKDTTITKTVVVVDQKEKESKAKWIKAFFILLSSVVFSVVIYIWIKK